MVDARYSCKVAGRYDLMNDLMSGGLHLAVEGTPWSRAASIHRLRRPAISGP